MLEYILLVAVTTAAISGFVTYLWLTLKRQPASTTKKQASPGSMQQASATSVKPAPPTLDVAGSVHPTKGNFGFLRLYNLGYAPVYDLCFLPGPLTKENLAPLVSKTLETMHTDGDAVGSAVMEFIHNGKALTKDEALCFVLLAQPNSTGHRIAAFVDKLRFPTSA